ncbi:MAG TPA: hypothetical protein VN577_10525 [Terriglobales bacterium]|nr:hypothetical protein [Terriglobales bacterium]
MRRVFLLLFSVLLIGLGAQAQTPATPQPTVVEYYYKVQWGHQQEFLELFKKNHYPILKKQIEMGRIASVKMEAPENHMTEDARWDYRVTIVFKDRSPFDEQALARQMYPDQATFKKEEQRRFEILLAHWDLPLSTVNLNTAQ